MIKTIFLWKTYGYATKYGRRYVVLQDKLWLVEIRKSILVETDICKMCVYKLNDQQFAVFSWEEQALFLLLF